MSTQKEEEQGALHAWRKWLGAHAKEIAEDKASESTMIQKAFWAGWFACLENETQVKR